MSDRRFIKGQEMDWSKVLIFSDEVEENLSNDFLIERIRNWRNVELADTDYTQLSDVIVDKAAYVVYRQELRDLMAKSEDAKLLVLMFPKRP